MQIKFDILWKKNLGVLYKDNEVDLVGKEAIINLDLNLVDKLEVNYLVNGGVYTDEVFIKDVENKVIIIPFKPIVLKEGVNEFEVVAYMKNGNIEISQTYTYEIEKSIGEGIPVEEGNSSSGSRFHSHDNLEILNLITQLKINEWNNKAEKDHTHSEYLTEHQDVSHLANKKDIYTKEETNSKILEEITKAKLEGEYVDLSNYVTKDQLNTKADKTELPTKVSELINDKNYITNIPSEYITETELDSKGYLTQHQDISHLALKSELHSHTNKSVLDEISLSKINEWDNKSTFDGNYNNLTNRPIIPRIEGLASETFVRNEIANAQLGGEEVDLSNYVTKEELNVKADKEEVPTKISDLINDSGFITDIPSEYVTEIELDSKGYLTNHQDVSHLATKEELFSKDYNDLTNKPSIPSLTGYATENYVTNAIANAQLGGGDTDIDLTGYATKDELNAKANVDDIPTKTSQLTNDSGYLTEVPSQYVTETELNQKGYLTEHQDISHLAEKDDLHSHNNKTVLDGITSYKVSSWDNKSNFSGSYNDLTNKPTIPSIAGLASEDYVDDAIAQAKLSGTVDLTGYATKEELNAKADTDDIPTKTSQLTNDSNFLTSIPSEYVTETELNQKGYLTSHQDISHLAAKSELHSHSNKSILDNITNSNITAWNNKSNFSGNYNDLTNKPTIPTTTSQLTNNSGFLTSIPSEYVTETELNQKGYLTNVPSEYITETELNNSLSNYALKSEIPSGSTTSEQLVTVTISNRRLTLTTDRRQVVSMANNTTITLPSVSSFTEIHLYFTASSNYTITFPTVKWQKTPSIASGKSYEFIFTYVNSSIGWLGGFVEYVN